ncbi:MAG: ABC transporter substrate-binding protein [Polyangiales bacterium]
MIRARRQRWQRVALGLWLASTSVVLGCRGESAHATAETVEAQEFRYQGFPNAVGYPELAEDLGYLAPVKLKWIGNTISGPQDIQTVVTGDTDFGGAFNGAVIKLIAAKAPVKAVVSYYGVDENTYTGYFVNEDSDIRGPRDLIGKKIAMNTLGAHHEFMLREYLTRGGLTPEEIKQVTLVVVPPVNGEQALRQHQVEVAALQSILRDKALERGGLRRLFTDHELYGTFSAGSIVMTNKTLRDRPHAVRQFVNGVGRAIEWARTQPPDEVRKRQAQIISRRNRGEDPGLTAYWKSTGIAKPGGLIDDNEYRMWLTQLEKDGLLKPGQVALRDLFTNEYNAFAGTK